MKTAIIGVSGALGRAIFDLLRTDANGHDIVLTSRDPSKLEWAEGMAGVEIRTLDLDAPENAAKVLADCEQIVFCPILSSSGPTARQMRANGSSAHLILFSSNNVGIDFESPVYAALRAEEETVSTMSGGKLAIIRPCMIYGNRSDGNIGRLIGLAERFRVLPLMGAGTARQQPVHYDDLALLTIHVLKNQSQPLSKVGAGGPEVHQMKEIYRIISEEVSGPVVTVRVPDIILQLVRKIRGQGADLSDAQIRRADADRLQTWPAAEGWQARISMRDGIRQIAALR
ncbi:NAD-dependent epimerase/dehydratase family protein [Ponticaulis koreensis]|uniref:NAD-dependent epimerase/dehydratase family protein n=1 Tax=Ponticaulis koreensis TaxID=1123045 RepID=UPI0003B5270B|nr:NAD(P)-dependent oxidoreductase [Ponticaulis koreensis]